MADRPDTSPTGAASILHPNDYPVQTVYSWERHGEFFSLFPGDSGEAPYDATEIFVRLYPFPEAMVREIYLEAGSRTHHHIAHEDILFYQVSGRRVQIVNERSREVNAGDASVQIAGVWKRVDQIVPGVFVEFSIERPAKAGAEATWMTAAEASVAVMTESGGLKTCTVKTFPLQGYELHEAVLPAGAALRPPPNVDPTLFYVVSGELQVRIGAVEERAEARAAIRAPAGAPFTLEATADSVVIYASIPAERPSYA